ncbi:Bromodomain-containing protein [Lophium mytilinum]|uniref:Bromodomain-containing protein n=1 Tax=Lophium mytilinum TaxID=390894 RepID=A0A6A6QAJ1_9PEZI|nr:Bromodomain-containing protein [Lophium mytilinum]
MEEAKHLQGQLDALEVKHSQLLKDEQDLEVRQKENAYERARVELKQSKLRKQLRELQHRQTTNSSSKPTPLEMPASEEPQTTDRAPMEPVQPIHQPAATAYEWPSGPMNEPQQTFLLERVNMTKKKKDSYAFWDPVDPVLLGIPTYPIIVRTPMCLNEMMEKLARGEYRSVIDFMKDLDLVVDNSILFNSLTHPIAQQGLNMRAFFLKGMLAMPGVRSKTARKPREMPGGPQNPINLEEYSPKNTPVDHSANYESDSSYEDDEVLKGTWS